MITRDELWEKAETSAVVPYSQLDKDLRDCVEQGDGLADHYGGRTPFTFLDTRDNRFLVLEKLGDETVRVREVLNCTGGYGTGILGSAVTSLEADLVEALHHSPTANDEFHSPDRFRLSRLIREGVAQHTGTDMDDWEVSFPSTGTEAMDLAVQLAILDGYSLATGQDSRKEKDVLVACHGAWHGWGGNPNQLLDRRQFTDGLPRLKGYEVVFMRYGDEESLQETFETYKGRIRTVFVEGILGDGGIILGKESWWRKLLDMAAVEDARVIDDEILTCFRTGGMLAIPKGHAPDCIALGKGLGMGLFPISAVLWRKDKMSLRPGIGVRTFNARPFMARVISAGLETFEEAGYYERSRILGEAFLPRLSAIVERFPELFKDARGQGLFWGLELGNSFARRAGQVRDSLIRHGVLSEVESGLRNRHIPKEHRINETIRLTPPLIITEQELDLLETRLIAAAESLTGVAVSA